MTKPKVSREDRDKLLEYPNVTGHSWGYKRCDGEVTDESCVRIYVEQKVPESELDDDDLLPEEFCGCMTDVIQSEPPQLADYSGPMGARGSELRPVSGSLEISADAGSGTLGTGLMHDADGDRVALTNRHVVCDGSTDCVGAQVNQGGSRIGEVKSLGPVDENDDENNLDAAVVKFDDDIDADASMFQFTEMGHPVEVGLGDYIVYGGRTSGYNGARVEAVDATATTEWSDGSVYTFTGLIEFDQQVWSGDSGSVGGIWMDETFHPAGLVMATDHEERAYMHPWYELESEFGSYSVPESNDPSYGTTGDTDYIELVGLQCKGGKDGVNVDVMACLTEYSGTFGISLDVSIGGQSLTMTSGEIVREKVPESYNNDDVPIVGPDDVAREDSLYANVTSYPTEMEAVNGVRAVDSWSDIPPGSSMTYVESAEMLAVDIDSGDHQHTVPSIEEAVLLENPELTGVLDVQKNTIKNMAFEVLDEDPVDREPGRVWILDEVQW